MYPIAREKPAVRTDVEGVAEVAQHPTNVRMENACAFRIAVKTPAGRTVVGGCADCAAATTRKFSSGG